MVKSSASSGKSVIASVLAAEWSRGGRVALVCHSKRQQRRAVLRMVVEMKARFKGEGVRSCETGVEGATWVLRGGVGAVMICTIDGLLGWCVTQKGSDGDIGNARKVVDACRKMHKFDGGIVVDEAHLVYGREKRRDLDAGQHVLPADMVKEATDALGDKRLAVFGDRNQLDMCEWDRRGERECLMVPPARIYDSSWKTIYPESWMRVRKRRLLAEREAWPVCCWVIL